MEYGDISWTKTNIWFWSLSTFSLWCQLFSTTYNFFLKKGIRLSDFWGSFFVLENTNPQPSSFSVQHAVKLQQGGNIGKSYLELWMPLEKTAAISHPPVVAISKAISAIRAEFSDTALQNQTIEGLKYCYLCEIWILKAHAEVARRRVCMESLPALLTKKLRSLEAPAVRHGCCDHAKT